MAINPVITKKPCTTIRAPHANAKKFFIGSNGSLWQVDASGAEVEVGEALVTSVFGRQGVVVAVAGDYNATKITNDSTVSGATVKAALEWLAANLAPLVGGKVPIANLPDAVLGSVKYQGTWNPATNTPELDDSTGEQGWYYVCTTGGTRNLGSGAIDFTAGDWAIHNGLVYEKVDAQDIVTSVAGRTGAITLAMADITDLAAALALLVPTSRTVNGQALSSNVTIPIWRSGTGAPGAGLGSNDDFYVDEASFIVYKKEAGSWTIKFQVVPYT